MYSSHCDEQPSGSILVLLWKQDLLYQGPIPHPYLDILADYIEADKSWLKRLGFSEGVLNTLIFSYLLFIELEISFYMAGLGEVMQGIGQKGGDGEAGSWTFLISFKLDCLQH